MKFITLFLISTILFSNVLSCTDGKSNIPKVLRSIVDTLPELIESVKNLKGCQTSELKPVCSKGYSYFTSIKEERLFKGVTRNKENLGAFYSLLLDGLPIIEADKSKIQEILEPLAYSGYEEIIGIDLIYDREHIQNNKGTYFTIFIDRNCNNKNALDFLYTGFQSQFILNKDVFALEESDKSFLGGRHTTIHYEEREANLSRDQYKDLLNLLQLGAFSDAADMVEAFESQA